MQMVDEFDEMNNLFYDDCLDAEARDVVASSNGIRGEFGVCCNCNQPKRLVVEQDKSAN